VRDDRRFTVSDLSQHFPQISRALLYDIVSSHLGYRRPHSMRRVYQNLCPATISDSIMAANMWKNSSKNVELDNNNILYETLFDFFLQRRGTYFLNKPRIFSGFVLPSGRKLNMLRWGKRYRLLYEWLGLNCAFRVTGLRPLLLFIGFSAIGFTMILQVRCFVLRNFFQVVEPLFWSFRGTMH